MSKDDACQNLQQPISNLDNCTARLAHVGIKIRHIESDDFYEAEFDIDDEAAYIDKQPSYSYKPK